MPEVKQHYDDLAERAEGIIYWEGLKYRMLHDDFDADWVRGNEPHGTMTFTNEPEPVMPDTAIHFVPYGSPLGVEQRLSHVEEFLKLIYP